MVAAGNEHGVVTVFQIPKSPPDSLPDSLKPKQKKQVERYSISGLHNSAVTTVEWSKNGMKLFSGDQDGLVVFTEIDFYMVYRKLNNNAISLLATFLYLSLTNLLIAFVKVVRIAK